jgi:hypothetical protein
MPPIIKNKIYKFEKDHILFDFGDKINDQAVGLILDGKAQFTYKLKNNRFLKMTIPKYGFIGIIESIANEPARLSKITFLEKSKIYFWNKDEFIFESSINPELGMKSIKFLSVFLRTINLKVQEID